MPEISLRRSLRSPVPMPSVPLRSRTSPLRLVPRAQALHRVGANLRRARLHGTHRGGDRRGGAGGRGLCACRGGPRHAARTAVPLWAPAGAGGVAKAARVHPVSPAQEEVEEGDGGDVIREFGELSADPTDVVVKPDEDLLEDLAEARRRLRLRRMTRGTRRGRGGRGRRRA